MHGAPLEVADGAEEVEECGREDQQVPQLVRAEVDVEAVREVALRELQRVDDGAERVQAEHEGDVGEAQAPHGLAGAPPQEHVPARDDAEAGVGAVRQHARDAPEARGVEPAVDADKEGEHGEDHDDDQVEVAQRAVAVEAVEHRRYRGSCDQDGDPGIVEEQEDVVEEAAVAVKQVVRRAEEEAKEGADEEGYDRPALQRRFPFFSEHVVRKYVENFQLMDDFLLQIL